MIDLDHLTKSFDGYLAVDDLSFVVEAGEILGFLGPNGAGKSTSMKMIAGALTPTSGTARLCGHDIVRDTRKAQMHLGYLPEGAPAWNDMTPDGFLTFLGQVRNMSGASLAKAKDQALEMANLRGVRHQIIETLSKGFKRRVGLAAALLHDPDILILDEPTDGLDPNQKHEVRRLIADLSGEKAIIISTHILEEVDAICSRAMVIANGRIVADETPTGLLARDPNHNSLLIQTNLTAAQLKSALQGLDHVHSIEQQPDDIMHIRPEAGYDIKQALIAHLQARSVVINTLDQKRGRMDDVFRQLTQDKG